MRAALKAFILALALTGALAVVPAAEADDRGHGHRGYYSHGYSHGHAYYGHRHYATPYPRYYRAYPRYYYAPYGYAPYGYGYAAPVSPYGYYPPPVGYGSPRFGLSLHFGF